MQRALMQYWLPRNHAIVRKALRLAHREDLIGFGKHCLVKPEAAEHKLKRAEKDKHMRTAHYDTKKKKV